MNGIIKVKNKAISPTKDQAFIDRIESYPADDLEYDDIRDAIWELRGSIEVAANDDSFVYVAKGDTDDNGNRWDIVYTLIGWDKGDLEYIRKDVEDWNASNE